MGVDLASGKKTDHGEPSGPRATSAVSPWLFSRQSRPATRRKEDKCARNSRAQRRPVRVSSDIIAAVFPHSGGAETNGGGNSWATMLPSRSRSRRVERRKNRSWRTNAAASHVGGVALFCFPPALTARAENFRTSERSAAFGESSPMRSRRRFSIQTGQRPRAAKKLGDDAVLKQSAPLLLCRSRQSGIIFLVTGNFARAGRGQILAAAEILPARARANSDRGQNFARACWRRPNFVRGENMPGLVRAGFQVTRKKMQTFAHAPQKAARY